MTGQREQKESQTTSEMGNPYTNCMANPHTRNKYAAGLHGYKWTCNFKLDNVSFIQPSRIKPLPLKTNSSIKPYFTLVWVSECTTYVHMTFNKT